MAAVAGLMSWSSFLYSSDAEDVFFEIIMHQRCYDSVLFKLTTTFLLTYLPVLTYSRPKTTIVCFTAVQFYQRRNQQVYEWQRWGYHWLDFVQFASASWPWNRRQLELERELPVLLIHNWYIVQQEVKIIWQKAPHGGPIPRLGVTPGGRNLYHWIPGVGVPISVP